jgi:hypothetical protein
VPPKKAPGGLWGAFGAFKNKKKKDRALDALNKSPDQRGGNEESCGSSVFGTEICDKWRHVPRDPKIEIVGLPAREEIVVIKKSHKLTHLLK